MLVNCDVLVLFGIYLYGFCENSVAVNLMVYHYVPSQIAALFPHAHTHDSLDKSCFFRGEIHVFDGHV